MTEQIIKENKHLNRFNKSIQILAIITAVLIIAWHCLTIITVYITNDIFSENLKRGARYIAFGGLGFSIITTILFMISFINIIKHNKILPKKQHILVDWIYAIATIVAIVFIILTATKIFDKNEWFGLSVYKTFVYMGIIACYMLFASVNCRIVTSKRYTNLSVNKSMIYTLIHTIVDIGRICLIPLAFIFIGGFINPNSIARSDILKFHQWAAACYATQLILSLLGTGSILLVCLIPLAIFEYNIKKLNKSRLIYLILIVLTFILFVITASLMTLKDGAPTLWVVNKQNIVISVFSLLTTISLITTSSLLYANKIKEIKRMNKQA